jgi:hypothetical protein
MSKSMINEVEEVEKRKLKRSGKKRRYRMW